MKKILMTLVGVLMAVGSWAYDVEVDGIYYNLIKKLKTAEVTNGPEAYTGSLVIPDTFIYDGVEYVVNTIDSIGRPDYEMGNSLTSITIPKTISKIKSLAFCWQRPTTSVNISSIEAWCAIDFEGDAANPLCIENDLYINGTIITDLSIPSGVTKISNYAFANSKIKSVDLPETLQNIGNDVFYCCENLTSIVIPNAVISIGANAFAGCM